MGLLANGVSALLIDGKLTSGTGGTFPTVNPATEAVLGAAADATAKHSPTLTPLSVVVTCRILNRGSREA